MIEWWRIYHYVKDESREAREVGASMMRGLTSAQRAAAATAARWTSKR